MRWSGERGALIVFPVAGSDAERRAWRKRLGYALARCREAAGETQDDAAMFMKVNVQTISRWENGAHEMRSYDLARLAGHYDVPTEWIIDPPDSISAIELAVSQRAAAGVRKGIGRGRQAS